MKRLSVAYRYVYEIADHFERVVYIGLTCNPKRRLSMHHYKGPATELLKSGGKFKILHGPMSAKEAVLIESQTVDLFRFKNYRILNRAKTGALGPVFKWNFAECKKEALKYSNRTEFKRGSAGAYESAVNHGWREQICKHMPLKYKRSGHWNFQNCKLEATKCNSRYHFRQCNVSAYIASLDNDWLPLFFPNSQRNQYK